MKKFCAPAIIAILVILAGCYYDNEEALYPEYRNSCDTSNVTFSGTVVPVLSNNCWSCHSDASAAFGGGVHLQKYADVKSNAGRIIPAIDGTGSKPMPPNGKMSSCGVAQLKIWVAKGMPEN
ncbi:MAG TPA: hypothetical protein VK155_05245 [Bacteroidales bacterium]|jgi:cytochrome c551/c552|nr:hypothetical protein [Bacteroidales bacterium]